MKNKIEKNNPFSPDSRMDNGCPGITPRSADLIGFGFLLVIAISGIRYAANPPLWMCGLEFVFLGLALAFRGYPFARWMFLSLFPAAVLAYGFPKVPVIWAVPWLAASLLVPIAGTGFRPIREPFVRVFLGVFPAALLLSTIFPSMVFFALTSFILAGFALSWRSARNRENLLWGGWIVCILVLTASTVTLVWDYSVLQSSKPYEYRENEKEFHRRIFRFPIALLPSDGYLYRLQALLTKGTLADLRKTFDRMQKWGNKSFSPEAMEDFPLLALLLFEAAPVPEPAVEFAFHPGLPAMAVLLEDGRVVIYGAHERSGWIIPSGEKAISISSDGDGNSFLILSGSGEIGRISMETGTGFDRIAFAPEGAGPWRRLRVLPDGTLAILSNEGAVLTRSPGETAWWIRREKTWSGRDLARSMAFLENGRGGYVLEKFGGLHPFEETPIRYTHLAAIQPNTGHYWPGRDFALALEANSDGTQLHFLDRKGGLHRFALDRDTLLCTGDTVSADLAEGPFTAGVFIPDLQRIYLAGPDGRIEGRRAR